LARHEGDFRAVAEAELAAGELRMLGLSEAGREAALARFLAGAEEWSEAVKTLGGAFASEPGLKERKDD
jgi:hypothetical protein